MQRRRAQPILYLKNRVEHVTKQSLTQRQNQQKHDHDPLYARECDEFICVVFLSYKDLDSVKLNPRVLRMRKKVMEKRLKEPPNDKGMTDKIITGSDSC